LYHKPIYSRNGFFVPSVDSVTIASKMLNIPQDRTPLIDAGTHRQDVPLDRTRFASKQVGSLCRGDEPVFGRWAKFRTDLVGNGIGNLVE